MGEGDGRGHIPVSRHLRLVRRPRRRKPFRGRKRKRKGAGHRRSGEKDSRPRNGPSHLFTEKKTTFLERKKKKRG